jgi:hypothetical protein
MDSNSKCIQPSDFNHIAKKTGKNPALGFLFHESSTITQILP